MAKSVKFALDFKVAEEEDLYILDIPLRFQIHTSGTIHGLAFWFDVAFIGSFTTVWVCHSKICTVKDIRLNFEFQVLPTLEVLELLGKFYFIDFIKINEFLFLAINSAKSASNSLVSSALYVPNSTFR